MRKYTSCETVEIAVNNASNSKFYFPELPNLRDKVIERIETFMSDQVSKTPINRDVVGTVLYNSYLVLVSNGNEVVNRIPLALLTKTKTYANLFPLNLIIDYPKSYVEVGQISALTAGEAFLFTFYFREKEFSNIVDPGSVMKVENIEIEINTTGTKFYFPDNENLRNKIIRKIEIPYTTAYLPSGESIISSTTLSQSYLTLVSKNKEIISKMPLYEIQNNRDVESMIVLDDIEVDFPKSYVEVPAVLSSASGKYFFNFFFFDKGASAGLHRPAARRHHPHHRIFRHRHF